MYEILAGLGILVPIIVKIFMHRNITFLEMGVQAVISVLFVLVAINIAKWADNRDVEVWNGALTSHQRVNDSHMESYSCNCRTVCSGSGENRSCSTRCDTCWRRRYTVDWTFRTTIGNFSVGHRNSLNRSIHRVADPAHFANAVDGMPVSREHGYQNYIRNVPSLFSATEYSDNVLTDIVPDYPRVYDYTQIDRVLTAGFEQGLPVTSELDQELDNCLRELGPEHQVNIVAVIANTTDPTFRYVLEGEWRGSKKNDVIVVIGAPNYPTIEWVDVFTLAGDYGNTLLVDELSLALMDIGTLEDATTVSNVIETNVAEHFERVPMEEFEELRSEVRPTGLAVAIIALISIALSIGLTLVFIRYDLSIDNLFNRGYRRRY